MGSAALLSIIKRWLTHNTKLRTISKIDIITRLNLTPPLDTPGHPWTPQGTGPKDTPPEGKTWQNGQGKGSGTYLFEEGCPVSVSLVYL